MHASATSIWTLQDGHLALAAMVCRCVSSGRGPEESGAVDDLREPSTDGRCSLRA